MMILFFMKFAKGIPRNSTIGCTMTKNVTAKTKDECVKLEKLREKYVKQTEKKSGNVVWQVDITMCFR